MGNAGGYLPCIYQSPATQTYWVAFWGPDGNMATTEGNAGTIQNPNTTVSQRSGVSMWDITIRRDGALNGTTMEGRAFTHYLAQIASGNGTYYELRSTFYAATMDGYIYQVDLNNLDPNGNIFYGNRVGFLDPDGKTPL